MGKQKTTEEFITDAQKVHGDKYDYSLVEYTGNISKIKIICRVHGLFEQAPSGHLSGCGCPKCAGKYMDTEYFKEKAKKVHGDKYDYSLVKYVGRKLKIKIICKEHGVFEQTPDNHLYNHGCSKCAGEYRPTTLEFIEKAKSIHGDKYDYSLVDYKNSIIKIKIICLKHRIFEQAPNCHLEGQGCPKCKGEKHGNERRSSSIEFIEKAKLIHGDKYEYSLVEYIGNKIKVGIICKEHGVFQQKPNNHLCGAGCPKCDNKNKTTEEFICEAKLIHNNKYDYSLVVYKKSKLKVKIICPKHGVFEQIPNGHLIGNGCLKCDNKNKTTEEFICGAKEVHGDKYDYSLVEYVNIKSKIKIICSVHGIFEQMPSDHLSGYGCKSCYESRGELAIKKYLDKKCIKYIREKAFDDCRNRLPLHFDYYLYEHNKLLEYDGKQHFMPIEYFGGERAFKLRQINDNIKNNYAKEKSIDLLRIRYDEIKNINQILDEFIK